MVSFTVTTKNQISSANQKRNITTKYAHSSIFVQIYTEVILQAMKQASVSDCSKCLFVDDNRSNVDAAQSLGWAQCVHFCERGLEVVEGGKVKEIGSERKQGAEDNGVVVISDLEELRVVWPNIFK
jgi:pyrimidine and pyridine-specific 5'-nucleotidase